MDHTPPPLFTVDSSSLRYVIKLQTIHFDTPLQLPPPYPLRAHSAKSKFQVSESMEQIQHKQVDVGGLKLHVAEIGNGPAVLFLHGFPEVWYSWRHQMVALAAAGFHAIAPDWRGYGLSDQPPEPEKATFMDLIKDLIAILDYFSIPKAFVVGKDFGAIPAYQFAAIHPERVSGVITLGLPYIIPGGHALSHQNLPKGFYILRWQEPGRAEADFGRLDVETVIRNIYILFSGSELPVASENEEIMDLVQPSTPLPNWFTEEDLSAYASLYKKSGFRFALQVPYRLFERSWKDEADHPMPTDLKVRVPAMLVMGNKDYVLKLPGMEDYINSALLKENVPDLEIVFMSEGTHFVQEQLPEQINELIISFIKKHI